MDLIFALLAARLGNEKYASNLYLFIFTLNEAFN